LGAALGLARRGFAPVLVERETRVGGNAGSSDLHGIPVDLGSHRLHPSTDPEILSTLRDLLGDDLLQRPRHGRILLSGRWIRFPLRPLDLASSAPPRFLAGVAWDLMRRLLPLPKRCPGLKSFASLLWRGLGPTICREFYFPYARKIWGLESEEISAVQAARRVSAGSMERMLRRVLSGTPPRSGRRHRNTFFYPRQGFGQLADALWRASVAAGAEIVLGTPVQAIQPGFSKSGIEVEVEVGEAEEPRTLSCDHLWSTLPLGEMVGFVDPPPPAEVLASAGNLQQRAIVLVYLVLEQGRFSEFDAHYFPNPPVPFTRLSEPKNYSDPEEPRDRTVLCAEIPCSTSDFIWTSDDEVLGSLVLEGLRVAGLPVRARLLDVAVRRLRSAYPIYRVGFEAHFHRVASWVSHLPGLVSFGRLGLFAHDNTHHALLMAEAAVRCMEDDGRFDETRWEVYRAGFSTHVVED